MAKTISNLDKSLKQNITPADIGAAASSHGTHLTLGTGSSNAYRGDYGNIAYNHSQAAHAPSNAQKNSDITKAEIEAKLTGNITSHSHSSYATTSTTGSLSSLQTSAKGSLVAAINEVFQSGANIKQQLVDILVANGASVSTSDSWDTLINYINENSNNSGLDIISATELPATGKENQICVITDNPVDNFMFSNIQSDLDASGSTVINGLLRPDIPENIFGGGTVITGDKFKCRYNINQFQQDGSLKSSYIYKDGNWNEFTIVSTNMLVNGTYDVNNIFGTFKTSSSGYYWTYASGDSLKAYRPASSYYCNIWTTSNTLMNFSGYNKVKVTAYALRRKTTFSNGSVSYSGGNIKLCQSSNSVYGYSGATGSSGTQLTVINQTSEIQLTDTSTEYVFDISSWTGDGYFGINAYTYEPSSSTSAKGYYVFITDICFV